jgi:hypothetical protein
MLCEGSTTVERLVQMLGPVWLGPPHPHAHRRTEVRERHKVHFAAGSDRVEAVLRQNLQQTLFAVCMGLVVRMRCYVRPKGHHPVPHPIRRAAAQPGRHRLQAVKGDTRMWA